MADLLAGVKARLASTFARIDALLGEAMQSTDPAALRSPLSRRIADVAPLQRQLVAEGADRLRAAMQEILQHHGAAAPAPGRSAAQDCRVVLDRVQGAIEDLRPRSMRGDDTALSDDAESELRRIVAQLLEPLDPMQRGLSRSTVVVSLGPGVLGELQRIVAAHDLAQFRAPAGRAG